MRCGQKEDLLFHLLRGNGHVYCVFSVFGSLGDYLGFGSKHIILTKVWPWLNFFLLVNDKYGLSCGSAVLDTLTSEGNGRGI